ncbi:chorismate mutase [Streptomyces avicenniae]|uniref:chorismate mutase n=1 Tax=Streptomyces avicenniae TaxID=500153 RepID=UPI00069A9561|nr:chorismate mutase [Streptomyces avicenniae]
MTTETHTTPSTDTDLTIASARARIDALDEQIIALITARVTASAEVQRARLAAGGRRVHLARENEILRRYHAGLGSAGTHVAMRLLELCRGTL